MNKKQSVKNGHDPEKTRALSEIAAESERLKIVLRRAVLKETAPESLRRAISLSIRQ